MTNTTDGAGVDKKTVIKPSNRIRAWHRAYNALDPSKPVPLRLYLTGVESVPALATVAQWRSNKKASR